MIQRLPNSGDGSKMKKMGGSAVKHPGKITFVNMDEGTTKVVDAATVPEEIRFANSPKGKVPVVRIVASTSGKKRTIQEYGVEGQMLRSTVQLKP